MNKPFLVFVSRSDELAVLMARLFVKGGETNARRPRFFEKGLDGFAEEIWEGEIRYGPGHSLKIEAKVVIGERLSNYSNPDWLIFSTDRHPKGHFTSGFNKLKRCQMPAVGNVTVKQYLALFKQPAKGRVCDNLIRNAADHLAATLTGLGVFRPYFLSFPGGAESLHFQIVADWVKQERPVSLVSACCLNADESRTGIVDSFAPDITDLLVRTAKAAFANFPQIEGWYIYTFGPDDFDWLGELGIAKVLLPYMWDAPRAKVRSDMKKNYELTASLVDQLNSVLPFPVTIGQLSAQNDSLDINWLVEISRERALKMLPSLKQNPPAIFAQLETEQEIFDRVQQEAFLYLIDTIRWGQLPDSNLRPPVLNVGLEVHGGYWAHGNLFEGPNNEFLPLSWMPQCVRQHWGEWVLSNFQLKKERERLNALLAQLGY